MNRISKSLLITMLIACVCTPSWSEQATVAEEGKADQPEAHVKAWQAGLAAFESGKFEAAAQQFESSIALSDSFAGRHMLGLSYVKLNNSDKARVHLVEAIRLASTEDRAVGNSRLHLARLLLTSNRLEDACEVLSTPVPASLDHSTLRLTEVLKVKANCEALPLETLRAKALELNNSEIWIRYAGQALRQGDTVEAQRGYEHAAALAPTDTDLRREHVLAIERSLRVGRIDARDRREGDRLRALLLETASYLADRGGDQADLLALADAYRRVGQFRLGLDAVGRAENLEASPESSLMKGRLYALLSRYGRALDALEDAVRYARARHEDPGFRSHFEYVCLRMLRDQQPLSACPQSIVESTRWQALAERTPGSLISFESDIYEPSQAESTPSVDWTRLMERQPGSMIPAEGSPNQ